MKLKDLPKGTNMLEVKVKIPADVKQLSDTSLTEGWIAGFMANGNGIFMTCDPPGSDSKRLIPTYPNKQIDYLEWEVADDDKTKIPDGNPGSLMKNE